MHHHLRISSILFSSVLLRAAVVAADQQQLQPQLPANYRDDLYHCKDPANNKSDTEWINANGIAANDNDNGIANANAIPCDPDTFLWKLEELNPLIQPDDSEICEEIVDILVRAKEKEQLDAGQLQTTTTQDNNNNINSDIQLWEKIMETSVVDQLEPCVLWAMTYGPLTQWASSLSSTSTSTGQQQQQVEIQDQGEYCTVYSTVLYNTYTYTYTCSRIWSCRAVA